MAHPHQISNTRLTIGGAVIVVGFLSPLLIPLVASTNWSIGLISAVSGLLALGIPEVFMIIGVAIVGKDGYQFLKGKTICIPETICTTGFCKSTTLQDWFDHVWPSNCYWLGRSVFISFYSRTS
jgi:hypothetical protein